MLFSPSVTFGDSSLGSQELGFTSAYFAVRAILPSRQTIIFTALLFDIVSHG